MPKHKPIPRDYEVQPLRAGDTAANRSTCGTCGLSWDDGKVTGITPAPAFRTKAEAEHMAADLNAHIERGEVRKFIPGVGIEWAKA